MNTILLQKILDILTEGLAHVGDFFKDLFVSDPQDGQVIGYDADAGKWKNMSVAELALDLTDTAGPDNVISFSDAADMPLKSLVANIEVEGGTDEVVITHTGKNLADASLIYPEYPEVTEDGKTCRKVTCGSSKTVSPKFFKPNTQYTVKLSAKCVTNGTPTVDSRGFVFFYSDSSLSYINFGTTSADWADYTATSTSGKTVVSVGTFTSDWRLNIFVDNSKFMLVEGTTATAYEPYTGTSNIVMLPSSVANGYIDVITGAGMNTDTSTPFTVTPVHISANTGVNNIFADTGDVTAEYYTKAAGDIKNLVCITEDITSDITKNTTDFSDILLKVSQNNKVVSIEIYSATTSAAVNDTFLSNLPKPAMNSKVLLVNTTLGEDGTILGTLKTTGELEIATSGAKSFSGLITYVAK